ncbi:MAG TPA: hemerythrin domain-containing protein [Candidatus Saccharimonadales bacterium]|nr:hemerythrin domain-containing protein [Candidatus Saccharimonadales bacterium]
MTSATQILRQEHETILEMIGALEAIVHQLETGGAIPVETLNRLTEFFVLFADRSHHGKEEDLLFPLMERRGVPRAGGPLGCMLAEHDEGRGYIRAMKESAGGCAQAEGAARSQWANAARGYATLLRNHIWKENEILFQIAERVLSPADQSELARQFAQVQQEKLDSETETRLAESVRKMRKEFAAMSVAM